MRFKSVHVRNFRALEEIDFNLDSPVNVIVGPNAIGKTTLLEAIRLAKAMVAPRSPNESNQALLSLGAAVTFSHGRVIPDAIARDPKRPVAIRCGYELESNEIEALAQGLPQIATDFTMRSMGQAAQIASFNLAFLSSPQGQAALAGSERSLRESLEQVRAGKRLLFLDLKFDPATLRFESGDVIAGAFFAFLDSRARPSQTVFSYFPADRALPHGEQPVQLGGADAVNQIEAHSSQPQLKYARLKNTIFNAVVTSPEERDALSEEFERIFGGILRGRKLLGVGINEVGLLSINVQDTETGRAFQLDGMSSGEKGLILTFLLIGRSISDGGIILLDEPELHLNPAVCKDLLAFLIDNYIVRKGLQAIICSHSPEILAGAFEREECSLYHLVSERIVSKVRYNDEAELAEALNKLGTSESEGLLYKATVFVEGDEDVDLLEVGFGDLLRRYKIKDLGGRREVEKQIIQLQEAERKGTKLSARYFIFDRDSAPTGLTNTGAIRLLQWDRHCLENYLIDLDVLTELLKDPDIVKNPFPNQGEVSKTLRDLAMSQIDESVARQVYQTLQFDDPGIRTGEIRGKTLEQIANVLIGRLQGIVKQMEPIGTGAWKNEFLKKCEDTRKQQEMVWDARWAELCDGKRLFGDLVKQRPFKISQLKFKKRIMTQMRAVPTANWRNIESLLKRLLQA